MKKMQYTVARADTGAVLPYAVVTVYQSDGVTLASLFASDGVTPASNPVTAGIDGTFTTYAADGTYVLSGRSADLTYTTPSFIVDHYVFASFLKLDVSNNLNLPAQLGVTGQVTLSGGLVVGVEQGGYVPAAHLMQIVSTGAVTPLMITGGSGSIEIWKDNTPTKANAFGCAVPGNSITNDLIFSRYDGTSYAETFRIVNATKAAQFQGAISAPNIGTAAAAALDTDGSLTANSDANIGSQKAIKTYVDNKVNGLKWKEPVRAATTAAGTLASSFANGSVIDGVTLATGDRILIKNQATASENGIYVVNASGAPTRATDADAGNELVNATCYVSEGTTLGDQQFTCSTNAPITVGTTGLTFVQSNSGSGVTSVALSAPSIFTVSGSPVTTTGTLTFTLASQSANLIFASPNGSAGAPTFRAIVGADFGSQSANLMLASPNGSAGSPSFRAIAQADLPKTAVSTVSASFTAASTDDNTHKVASGATQTLTLNSTPATGVAFTIRFTTAWSISCAGGLSKNGASPTGVTTGSVAANSLITFIHEGSGVWAASGSGLT